MRRVTVEDAQTVTFDEALERNPAPRSVGDVLLQYDAPVLIGRTPPPLGLRSLLPEVLYALAAAAGVGVLATLLVKRDAHAQALLLTAVAAALATSAARVERTMRQERRFILHFADEQLRLEAPMGRSRQMRRVTVPFDDVREVFVVQSDRGEWQLYVEYVPAPDAAQTVAVLLVDRVGEDDVEALQRLWATLRRAFGIRSPAAE